MQATESPYPKEIKYTNFINPTDVVIKETKIVFRNNIYYDIILNY